MVIYTHIYMNTHNRNIAMYILDRRCHPMMRKQNIEPHYIQQSKSRSNVNKKNHTQEVVKI